MNSQLDQKRIAPQSVLFSENEAIEVIAATTSSRPETPKANKAITVADELIATLQNHRENRRARQVFEWETTRRGTPNYL